MTPNILTTKTTNVGVIVARFQVDTLHDAHKSLIDTVRAKHDRVIIFLGVSVLKNSPNNPIPFIHRMRMVNEIYPDIELYPIHDMRSDELWSSQLDRSISEWVAPGQTVTLYGSRDSFIKHYTGKHPTEELVATEHISGTEVRQKIITNYPSSKDFRAGMIGATGWRYPTAYQTVDVAILNSNKTRMVLGRKAGENLLRFIGGFSDPSSDSLEADAIREAKEETGLDITNVTYIGSCGINDWRYAGEKDKIKTALFMGNAVDGAPVACDDIVHADYYPIDDILNDPTKWLLPEHVKLAEMLKVKLATI